MTKLQGSWIWFELMTGDPAKAKGFYDSVVGWSIDAEPAGEMDYRMIARSDGGLTGGVMRLTPDMQAGGARPCWVGYLGVDNVDTAIAAVTAQGGKLLMPAFDIPAGRIAMVADCCGAPFYIMTPQSAGGDGESTAFSPAIVGSCAWNELMAGNQANALDFYTGLFGWSLPEPMDMGPMGSYQFIEHDGVPIGAIMQKPAEAPAPVWNHYFRVADINAAADAVRAGGGQVINGPHPVPGDDWIIQGIDPEGVFFCLVGAQG